MYTKLRTVQNLLALFLIKLMDILENMIKQGIYHYFIHEKKYEGIFDKIRYLMSESNISDAYSHKFL